MDSRKTNINPDSRTVDLAAKAYQELAQQQVAKCVAASGTKEFSPGLKMIYTINEAPVFVMFDSFQYHGEQINIEYALDLRNSILFTESQANRQFFLKLDMS